MPVQHLIGDCREVLRTLPAESVHCCVTSPPYWGLRDYGVSGQRGREATPSEYVENMVADMQEVSRVLRNDGTLWLNIGDSYVGSPSGSGPQGKNGEMQDRQVASNRSVMTNVAGLRQKNLIGVPWKLAFALQDAGWYLRQDIVWHKPNPMPESVTDRCTKSHEYLFLLTKSDRYCYDHEAIKEPLKRPDETKRKTPAVFGGRDKFTDAKEQFRLHSGNPYENQLTGRNKRSVWTISTKPYKGAHFACFPHDLVEPCIKAGTSEAGCCGKCGAQYKRVLKKVRVPTRPAVESKVFATSGEPEIVGNRDPERHVTRTETVGFMPTCGCGAEAVPCTVLDPFAGSGTTGMVATRLKRDCILIDLNPEYLKLQLERVGA